MSNHYYLIVQFSNWVKHFLFVREKISGFQEVLCRCLTAQKERPLL